jgi:hypothetical protein
MIRFCDVGKIKRKLLLKRFRSHPRDVSDTRQCASRCGINIGESSVLNS